MKKLSIGMMVKNEEKYLDRCLSAIKPIIESIDSELIIVDTGSVDSTVEIAKRYTSKVYSHEWKDDFSYMRNKVLSYAKGEWFLFLDADEIVLEYKPLLDFLNSKESNKYNSGTIIINNILDGKNPDNYNMFFATRLARRSKDFHFVGKIHEQPQVKPPLINIGLVVEHYGYDNTDEELMDYKFERSSKLLLAAVTESPENIYMWFQLSKTYQMHGDNADALESIEKAYDLVKSKPKNERHNYVYVYSQIARLYISIGNLNNAVNIVEEGILLKPYVMDLWFYLGKAQVNRKKYREAFSAYTKYFELRDNHQNAENIDITIVNGTINRVDEARHEIAYALMKLGEYEQALVYCDEISVDYSMYKEIVNIKIRSLFLEEKYVDVVLYTEYLYNYQDDNNRYYFAIDLIEHIFQLSNKDSLNNENNVKENDSDIIDITDYQRFMNELSCMKTAYGKLFKLRLLVSNINSNVLESSRILITEECLNELRPCLWKDIILYYLQLTNETVELTQLLSSQRDNKILEAFTSTINEEDCHEIISEYAEDLKNDSNFNSIRVCKSINLSLLQRFMSEECYDRKYLILNRYLDAGLKYVHIKYSSLIMSIIPPISISNEEDTFLIIYNHATVLQKEDKNLEFIKLMRQTLGLCPSMSSLIELVIEQFNVRRISKSIRSKVDRNKEYNELKIQIHQSVEELITEGLIIEARRIVNEYESINPDEIETASMKSIILIIENKYEEARDLLINALKMEPFNFDLLYNLASLYEIVGDSLSSYRMFKKALMVSSNEYQDEIKEKIVSLSNISCVHDYLRRKKVLFIAYIFPPLSGSGVQRSLKFVKYLRETGWEPIVLTVGAANFSFMDEEHLSEIPDDIEIIRVDERMNVDSEFANKVLETFDLIINDKDLIKEYLHIINSTEQFQFVPDSKMLWVSEVLSCINDSIDLEKDIDLIYTTSGPYSSHIIGYILKKLYKKPWVADFRDEWTNNPYIEYDREGINYKLSYSLENAIVHSADNVIAVTPTSRNNYIENFRLSPSKVVEITNGYDEMDFHDVGCTEIKNDKFTIMHNGMLYMIRQPITFINAVYRLISKGLIDKDKIRVIFGWTENVDMWKDYINSLGLENVVEFHDYMSHRSSLNMAFNSDALLLIVGEGEKNRGVYSGKIFEYFRLEKPLISLSPHNSDVDKLINKTKRGYNIEFSDVEGIEKAILNLFNEWLAKGKIRLEEITDVSIYERKYLTRKLSVVFDQMYSAYRLEDNMKSISELSDTFYNDLFKSGGWNNTYNKKYYETIYFDAWEKALEIMLTDGKLKVIEIGCGPGQFANFLFDNGIYDYYGIDFSLEAVNKAITINCSSAGMFDIANAYQSDIYERDYDLAIIFEMLEHIEDDFAVLSKIRSNTHVLFSVPNFYSEGHVRWFNSKQSIYRRYKELVSIRKIYPFSIGGGNIIYLVDADRL